MLCLSVCVPVGLLRTPPAGGHTAEEAAAPEAHPSPPLGACPNPPAGTGNPASHSVFTQHLTRPAILIHPAYNHPASH